MHSRPRAKLARARAYKSKCTAITHSVAVTHHLLGAQHVALHYARWEGNRSASMVLKSDPTSDPSDPTAGVMKHGIPMKDGSRRPIW